MGADCTIHNAKLFYVDNKMLEYVWLFVVEMGVSYYFISK